MTDKKPSPRRCVTFRFHLTPHEHARMMAIAKTHGVSASELLRRALVTMSEWKP